jgi:hypothetical protein
MKKILFEKESITHECVKYFDHNEIIFNSDEKSKKSDNFETFLDNKHAFINPFRVEKTYNTEKSFTENFNNPLYSISVAKNVVLVEKDEENSKVSIKFYDIIRSRRVGNKWLKTKKNMFFITVNLKTGDVYVGEIINYQLKRNFRKKLIRNSFYNKPLANLSNLIKTRFDNTHFKFGVAEEAISTFIDEVDNKSFYGNLTPNDRLFKFYLTKRNIKFPNNFNVFSDLLVGPKVRKMIKKNDNRMIDGFMEYYGFSGKKIKNALHNCDYFNYQNLDFAIKTFGYDWVTQNEKVILACINYYSIFDWGFVGEKFYQQLTKKELSRVFEIFKEVVVNKSIDYYTFMDHARMYVRLKEYGETDLKWMSTAYGKVNFRDEHLDWADKLDFYVRGYYNRTYPEYSYETIQKPIVLNGDTYYPVLLDDSNNYNLESTIQSNCVKTYIGKTPSIIISLRKGDIMSEERATLEYFLSKPDSLKISRIQSLGKFNKPLPKEWDDVLFILDKVMLDYINDSRFETVKIKKACKNGKEFFSDSDWNLTGELKWNYNGEKEERNIWY